MPDQIINIPGLGDIAFPDSMSEQDITAAATHLYEGGAVPRQNEHFSRFTAEQRGTHRHAQP